MTDKTFTCGLCRETFTHIEDEEWSDGKANAEALGIFGVEKASTNPGMAVVCDDCFTAMGLGS